MATTLDASAILKACIIGHFSLSTLAMIAHWLPNAYLWSQTVIVVLGLWAIASPENVESLNLLAIANTATILLDTIIVGVSWTKTDNSGLFSFTAAMAIILIVFKVAYAFFSFRFARERSGGESVTSGLPTFGDWGRTQNNTGIPSNTTYQNQ